MRKLRILLNYITINLAEVHEVHHESFINEQRNKLGDPILLEQEYCCYQVGIRVMQCICQSFVAFHFSF